MRNNSTIQVFEYELLFKGQRGFTEHHWRSLGHYNETYGGNFFKLTPDGVRFQNYVGVIQVGNITIEILPKIGRSAADDADKAIWQKVLINMLRECNWMRVHTHEKAALQYNQNSILEAYLEIFLRECESLLHRGLIKKYRQQNNNCSALKGKLLFAQNLQRNIVHQERFYTKHQVYDKDNVFNRILLKALKIIPLISQSPVLKDRVYSLLLSFPDLSDIRVSESTFTILVFDRKSDAYREAIEIAAMLLLNYRPDISSGHNHVLAILFDMNSLWEEYVFRQMKKKLPLNCEIQRQENKPFWTAKNNISKAIKPDIVVKYEGTTIIIDTKWKLPENNIPSDNDLKQMFVYNEYWSGTRAILLYPNSLWLETPHYEHGTFGATPLFHRSNELTMHSCGIMKISVMDGGGRLDGGMGERVWNKLMSF